MEEILASIRRIIAEDGDAASAAADDKTAGRAEEVLELTEVVEEDGTVVSLTPGVKKPVVEPPPPPPKRAPLEPVLERPGSPPLATERDEPLLSSAAAAAAVSALSQLKNGPRADQLGALPLGDAGRTLEHLVRELLRPMLRDWLDSNLPQLVERLVQEEIQRMSREAQGR